MPPRRRRADAQRSIAAILDAAVKVLNTRPDASMEEIAQAAGVTRQTVYAHYPSRDALVIAVGERALADVLSALEAAELGKGPPEDALERLLDITWEAAEEILRIPFPRFAAEEERELHDPMFEPLERLIRRGQRAGAFDRRLPSAWLGTSFFALSHAAAEEVAAGRLSPARARKLLRRSVLHLFGVPD